MYYNLLQVYLSLDFALMRLSFARKFMLPFCLHVLYKVFLASADSRLYPEPVLQETEQKGRITIW